MWCRIVEVSIGCWLAMSPFIFRHPAEMTAWWVNDLLCALAVVVLALASLWHPLRHVHLMNCLVAGWLICYGYLRRDDPVPPAAQNDLLVGWLLLLFAILPTDATQPPRSWEEFYARSANRDDE